MSEHLKFGAQGERIAARYLRRRGYRVLKRRYQTDAGEVDLIVSDGTTVVFVEVKTRADSALQDPLEFARPQQFDRITRAAQVFMRRYDLEEHRPCRFDVVSIVWPARGKPTIEHFEDAYESHYA